MRYAFKDFMVIDIKKLWQPALKHAGHPGSSGLIHLVLLEGALLIGLDSA
jgi:hypothetical protein